MFAPRELESQAVVSGATPDPPEVGLSNQAAAVAHSSARVVMIASYSIGINPPESGLASATVYVTAA